MEGKIAKNMFHNSFLLVLVIDEWLLWLKKYLYGDMTVNDTMGYVIG
jgi:hypothetical protein